MNGSVPGAPRALLPVLGVFLLGGACAAPVDDHASETASATDQNSEAPSSTPAADSVGGSGWTAPPGSSARLGVDDERGSVIELTGGGETRLAQPERVAEPENTNFNLSWDMRFDASWTVDVDVTTTEGQRTLRYQPLDADALGTGARIAHGVGGWESDDRWHSIQRDLSADLRDARPNASIISVDRFSVQGNGRVDAIHVVPSIVDEPLTTTSANTFPVAAGRGHSCVINSGALKCWGANNVGQVGNNSLTTAVFPVQVSGLTAGVTQVVAVGDRTCAVVSGAVKCWGSGSAKIPTLVAGVTSGVSSMTAGAGHTCAIVSGGVKCWKPTALTPVAVTGLTSGVISITAGKDFTCALTSAGAVKCWGVNTWGQLGNNTLTPSTVPVQVSGLTSGVLSIAAGDGHVCARLSSSVRCWGLNNVGQLGNNTLTSSKIPVTVSGLTAVQTLTGGAAHTCAIASGAVKCWGSNGSGQIGDNTLTTPRKVPVQVSGITTGATAVAAGTYHTCARLTDNSTRCWGYGGYGELGSGFTTNSLVPVETAQPISAVGQITKPGSYVLTANLTTATTTPPLSIHDTSNVTLNCNSHTITNTGSALSLIQVTNVTNLTVTKCVAKDEFSFSIAANNLKTATIKQNTLSGSNIDNSNAVRFTQNNVTNYVQQHFTNNSLIDANTFIGPDVGIIAGMVVLSNGTGNRVINNTMDGHWGGSEGDFGQKGSDDGVVLGDENGCEVSGNTITNNWDAAIESVGNLNNCTIANNKISNALICAIGGWYSNSWKGNKVTGNTASNVGGLFELYRAYALRSSTEIVYFRDNVFTGNIETNNPGYPTFIDMSLERAMTQTNGIPIDAAHMSVGNNHFGGNTFGGPTPYMLPKAAIVDDGGNVCAKGTDPTHPLACGRP